MGATAVVPAAEIFLACQRAIAASVLIHRVSDRDKEFHFQNWFQERLVDSGFSFDPRGRNSYPDFTLVRYPEGYEVKGLAYPGRWKNYDANSQIPRGWHNDREVFYVFGRYPSKTSEREYPVIDFCLCHGDFLNADHRYIHKNLNVRGFGSYGDIIIRDRKMYVPATPFALVEGASGHRLLILPASTTIDDRFVEIGTLIRTETHQIVVGYEFDLRTNTITPRLLPNPDEGKEHPFTVYKVAGDEGGPVSLVESDQLITDGEIAEMDDEEE